MYRIAVTFLVANFVFPLAGKSEDAEKGSEYASSLLRLIHENAASIVSYDVSIKEQRLKAPPGRDVELGRRKARLLWSEGSREWLYATVGETERAGANEDVQSGWTAALYGERKDCFFASSRGFRTVRCEEIELVRNRLGWPDFSTLGLVAYPHWRTANTSETIEQMLVPSDNLTALVVNSSTVTVTYRSEIRKGVTIIQVWNIDTDKYVPLVRKSFVEEEGYPRYLKAQETYEWEKAGSVFVPRRIVCDVLQSLRGEHGERVDYEVSTETEFDWRSLNKAIDVEQFRKESIDSIEKIRALVSWEH